MMKALTLLPLLISEILVFGQNNKNNVDKLLHDRKHGNGFVDSFAPENQARITQGMELIDRIFKSGSLVIFSCDPDLPLESQMNLRDELVTIASEAHIDRDVLKHLKGRKEFGMLFTGMMEVFGQFNFELFKLLIDAVKKFLSKEKHNRLKFDFKDFCVNEVVPIVTEFELSKAPSIVTDLVKSGFLDMTVFPKVWVDALKEIIPGYLDKIDYSIKQHMVAHFLRVGLSRDQFAHLNAVLLHAGPAFQKFFQAALGYVKDADLVSSLNKIKSRVPPMPKYEFEEAVRRFSDDSLDIFPEPISSGTVAQVHKAVYRDTIVALKIVRPSATKKLKKEIAFYKALLIDRFPYVYRQIQTILASIKMELDFDIEANLAEQGKKQFQRPGKHIFVPKVHQVFKDTEGNAVAIAFEYVRGESLDQFLDKLKKDTGVSISKKNDYIFWISDKLQYVYEKLVSSSFFEQGFYHADLHAGNIMVQRGDLNPDDVSKWKMWIIDYGNAGRLPPQLVIMYQLLGTMVGIRKPKFFVEVIRSYAKATDRYNEASEEEWADFEKITEEYIQYRRPNDCAIKAIIAPLQVLELMKRSQLQMERILVESTNLNIPLPDPVLKMYRGIFALRSELEDLKEMSSRTIADVMINKTPETMVASACSKRLIYLVPKLLREFATKFMFRYRYAYKDSEEDHMNFAEVS